jgi:hypothetical protein
MIARHSIRHAARHVGTAAMLALALALASCSDPKRVRFASETPDAVLAQLQGRKGLSVDETRLLYAFVARTRIDVVEGTGPPLAGRTVGEVIAEERAWEQAHAEAIAGAQLHSSRRKERQAEAQRSMTDVLTVRVWEAIDVAEQAPGTPRQLRLRLGLSNGGARDIVAFEGTVRFTDVYGRDQFECPVHVAELFAAGEDTERMVFVQCVPSPGLEDRVWHVRLADTKMTWDPYVVRFKNGEELTVPEE